MQPLHYKHFYKKRDARETTAARTRTNLTKLFRLRQQVDEDLGVARHYEPRRGKLASASCPRLRAGPRQ